MWRILQELMRNATMYTIPLLGCNELKSFHCTPSQLSTGVWLKMFNTPICGWFQQMRGKGRVLNVYTASVHQTDHPCKHHKKFGKYCIVQKRLDKGTTLVDSLQLFGSCALVEWLKRNYIAWASIVGTQPAHSRSRTWTTGIRYTKVPNYLFPVRGPARSL